MCLIECLGRKKFSPQSLVKFRVWTLEEKTAQGTPPKLLIRRSGWVGPWRKKSFGCGSKFYTIFILWGWRVKRGGQFTHGETQINLHYLEVALVFPCNILVFLPKKLDILLGRKRWKVVSGRMVGGWSWMRILNVVLLTSAIYTGSKM